MKSFSCVRLFATPWIVAHQAPPSMGFSRQEYWNGLPLPFPNWPTRLCYFQVHNIGDSIYLYIRKLWPWCHYHITQQSCCNIIDCISPSLHLIPVTLFFFFFLVTGSLSPSPISLIPYALPLWQPHLFSVCMTVLLHFFICFAFRFHIYVKSYRTCLSKFDLFFLA